MATATIRINQYFDESFASDALAKAIGAKEKIKVVEILTNANNAQRQMLKTPYKTKYGKDLIEELKKVFSGDFEDLVVSLMHTPAKYDAVEMNRALKGLGTNEKNLIEILSTRSNEEIEACRNVYQTVYGKKLEDAVVSDTSGDFKKLLVIALQAQKGRETWADSTGDSTKIIKSLDKKSGVDKFDAFKIFATASPPHAVRVATEVERVSGKSFEKLVEKELSGDFKNFVLALVESARNTPRFLAAQINAATKGFGTRDKDLIRVIVSRSEQDLALIEHEYATVYGKSLVQTIKEECKGEYRDGLLAVLKGNVRR